MNALRRLPPDGQEACRALGAATKWSVDEWAKSVVALSDAGLYPTIGLQQIFTISQAAQKTPLDVANDLIAYAAQILKEAQDADT